MNCSQKTQAQTSSPVPHRWAAARTKSAVKRLGFTLVELLVVIAIIGILISMLAVAVGPVLIRVQEGAVTTELQQLDLAVENFNNQYGFYPPSFTGFSNVGGYDPVDPYNTDSAAAGGDDYLQLLPFLNKISPNHREMSTIPGDSSGRPRLQIWWVNIGRHLDDRSSLVFWLSGLCENKQFPITGGLSAVGGQPQLPVAFGVPQSILMTANKTVNSDENLAQGAGGRIDIPRDSFFDFRGGQLADRALNLFDTTSPIDLLMSPQLPRGIRVYTTRFGDARENRGNEYFYRNSGFYRIPGAFAFHAENGGGGNERFVNPNTFQLFTYGRDGLAGNVALDDNSMLAKTQINDDNLTNFANGRLQTFDWRANLGL